MARFDPIDEERAVIEPLLPAIWARPGAQRRSNEPENLEAFTNRDPLGFGGGQKICQTHRKDRKVNPAVTPIPATSDVAKAQKAPNGKSVMANVNVKAAMLPIPIIVDRRVAITTSAPDR